MGKKKNYFGTCDHKDATKYKGLNKEPDIIEDVMICTRCHQVESIRLRYPPVRARAD